MRERGGERERGGGEGKGERSGRGSGSGRGEWEACRGIEMKATIRGGLSTESRGEEERGRSSYGCRGYKNLCMVHKKSKSLCEKYQLAWLYIVVGI